MTHRLRRREFLAEGSRAALGLALLPPALPAQKNQKPADSRASLIADLETLLPKLMEELVVPGASIALVKDAKLFWRRGFGVRDSVTREPVDESTVFEAASVSKTVFAYAAMKFCERGIIGLDTPLTRYLPKPFLEGNPRLDLITARRVLCHTTGFQNWRSKKEPLSIHFTPGEKFSYSGEGYCYLQTVLTQVTGQPIETCMRKNVLVPFGMTSSGYAWNDTFEKRAARPHDPDGKPFENNKPTAADLERYAAAGELRTTPTDYARFLIEVIAPKKTDAFRLNKKTLKEMLRPQVKVDDSSSWALGWQIRHSPKGDLIEHGGDNKGFHAFTSASVERRSGFIIMTNGENGWKLIANPKFAEVMTLFVSG